MMELASYPLAFIFGVSLALIVAASELGHWLARRAGDRASSNISTMEASILGLLALMISFTFAMALSRFEARREAVLSEANTIGTTALRARLLKAVTAKDTGLVPTGLFIQTLNEMIDTQETRLTAVRNRVPNIVLLALYGITFVAITFTGYAAGLEKRRWRPGVYLTGLVAAAVILLIQDLDRPSAGFITVSQQPMIDVAASLATYSE